MRIIKTAVIGSGFMGAAHIEALKRIGGVEIRTIVSDDLKTAKGIADKFGISKVEENYEKILNDSEIDIIHNCTPNNLHFKINKAAVEAGKHVISEKPLTTNTTESEKLVKLVSEKGVVNAINFNYRFYPVIQHAKNMIQKGELGEIFLAHGHYLQDWLYYKTDYNWRLETEISGNSRAIADIGSHWCDMIQFLTGLKITKVFADLVTIHKTRFKPKQAIETFKGKELETSNDADEISINTEDCGSVIFYFENGRRGVFTVSQVSAGRKNRFWFEIDGSKKALAFDQENPNSLWLGYRDKTNEILIKDPSLLDPDARKYSHYPGGHPEGYPDGPKNLFANVYEFIRSGEDPRNGVRDFPTFIDGHYENKIVEAVLESNKTQKWIEIK